MNLKCIALILSLCVANSQISAKLDSPTDSHSDQHLDKVVHDAHTVPADAKHDVLPNHVKLYQKFFKAKRKDQVGAVQYMLNIKEAKAQVDFVNKMVNEAENSLNEAKKVLDSQKFNGSVNDFPAEDSPLKEAIAKTLESTAFYGEMALKLPHIIEKRFKKDVNFRRLIMWAYSFSINFGLYDDTSLKMMNLAGQQLEIIPRQENFENPYDRMKIKEQIEREAALLMEENRKKKQAAKKPSIIKNKPSLKHTDL
uniref:Coiled-coil domain-containing protein n=1 Tax=Steinernema glaseri TaxID=37863 RepID=A0A1I7YJ58_9BILA